MKYVPVALVVAAIGLVVFAFLRPGASHESDNAPSIDSDFRGTEDFAKDASLMILPVRPRSFEVELFGEAICNAGDGDIIGTDKKASRDPSKFLATVEALGSAGEGKVTPAKASFTPPEKGATTTVSLPFDVDGARQLGFYLCYDEEKTGRCSDKAVANVNEVLLAYNANRETYVPKSRPYAFGYLLYDGRNLRAFSTITPSDFAYERLRQFVLFLRPMVGRAEEAAREIATAKNYDSVLRPHPFSVAGNRVRMSLGFYDEGACEKMPKLPKGKRILIQAPSPADADDAEPKAQ